jgi:flagellar basal-body rod modification protein FlgD
MSSVAATAPTTPYTDNTSARVVQKTLGESDFLKLLTTQMTNQDPMNPVSDTAQIAQLAQFSTLQSMNTLVTNSQLESASNLIGKNVTAMSTNGASVNGTVDSVQMNSGTVYVTVAGQQYAYSSITQVQPAVATAPTP